MWLGQLALSLGIYFCFAAKLTLHEAVIGAVVAALAATGSYVVLRERVARLAHHGRWIAQAWRLPKYAVVDTWAILAVLVRHLVTQRKAGSMLLEVPFAAGDDARDAAARRALAAAYTTMTPSTVVLGFDDERGRMIVHQLERSAISEMTRRLGAWP